MSEGFKRGWKYRLSFLTYQEIFILKNIVESEINERIKKEKLLQHPEM